MSEFVPDTERGDRPPSGDAPFMALKFNTPEDFEMGLQVKRLGKRVNLTQTAVVRQMILHCLRETR